MYFRGVIWSRGPLTKVQIVPTPDFFVRCRDQAEVKRLERAKSKAEAVSRRHLDELALIRRLQRQKLGVGRKQKLTVQERETKKLLDAKVSLVYNVVFLGMGEFKVMLVGGVLSGNIN